MPLPLFNAATRHFVHARALAERIDARRLPGTQQASTPWLLEVDVDGQTSWVVAMRYGAAVVVAENAAAAKATFALLSPSLVRPLDDGAEESVFVDVNPALEANAPWTLHDDVLHTGPLDAEHLQMLGLVLARSVLLDVYEERLAQAFDRIEPWARELATDGRIRPGDRGLMQQLGQTLLLEQRMVGRVEMREKPELLWENAHLERIYARLEDTFEISERDVALERKVELVHRTVSSLHTLSLERRTYRVEVAIVALIVVEVVLMLFELLFARH